MLEASSGPQWKVGESLPPSANPVLAHLGLTDGLQRVGLPSFGNRSLWGSAEPVERDFVFGTTGVGWRIERRGFEAELASAAAEAGVTWRHDSRLVSCVRREPRGWCLGVLTADGPRSYPADVVVDASGRPARLARLLGIHRVRYDRLVGAAHYQPVDAAPPGSEQDSTVLVEAVPQGWWYSMFLPDDRLVLAFLTDGDLLDRAGVRRRGGLSMLLEAAPATRGRLLDAGGALPEEGPQVRPAHTARLARIVGADWLAVGEAAVAFDPLASYGIAAALGAGCHAGAAVVEHLGGQPRALADYARLVDSTFARYLVLQHDRYAVERRWSEEIFWRRRHRSVRR